MIAKEVDQALTTAVKTSNARVTEYTVAPQITPVDGLPYHEWFIEFEKEPEDLDVFIQTIDSALQEQNAYYKDLITGKVLQQLHIKKVKKGGFKSYMKTIGKLGGQNKIPRLSNDRKIAESLLNADLIN